MDTFILVFGHRARYVFDFGAGDLLTEGRYGGAPAKLTPDQRKHIFATWPVREVRVDGILYRRPKRGEIIKPKEQPATSPRKEMSTQLSRSVVLSKSRYRFIDIAKLTGIPESAFRNAIKNRTRGLDYDQDTTKYKAPVYIRPTDKLVAFLAKRNVKATVSVSLPEPKAEEAESVTQSVRPAAKTSTGTTARDVRVGPGFGATTTKTVIRADSDDEIMENLRKAKAEYERAKAAARELLERRELEAQMLRAAMSDEL